MSQPIRTALVAEDNSALSRVISFALRRAGFQTTVAINGDEAWEAAQVASFDLIVTDYQMPGLTGVELAARIRDLPNFAETPIVLLTAKALELNAEQLRDQYGVAAVLTKPFSPSELAELVNRLTAQPA